MTTTATLTRLRRIRIAVRSTFLLGIAVSIAANVLHAEPNPISQAVAAWAPLALLLCVELISRVPVHRPRLAFVRIATTGIIAAIAAWVSYWHMFAVATRYGETGLTPYLLPVSVDGLIVVASISLVELAGRIRDLETPTTPAAAAAATDNHDQDHNTDTNTPAPDPVPVELLSHARLLANAHQQANGNTITAAELATRMGITEPTAAQLLPTLTASPVGPTPAPPAPARINGTHVPTTGTAVQEALL